MSAKEGNDSSVKSRHSHLPTTGRSIRRRTSQLLNKNWQLRRLDPDARGSVLEYAKEVDIDQNLGAKHGDWVKFDEPEQVHEVLLKAGEIRDPGLRDGAEQCQWIAASDWIYRTTFDRPQIEGRVLLLFWGLDTLVDIFLNSVLIASHDDMFLPLRIEVTGLIEERNKLVLHFRSPMLALSETKHHEKWDGKISPIQFIRKPAPDFGPFVGAPPGVAKIGVFDDVVLEVAGLFEIEHMDVTCHVTDPYDVAHLGLEISGFRELGSDVAGTVVDVVIHNHHGEQVAHRQAGVMKVGMISGRPPPR
jgi:beta-mannosidase